MKLFSRPIRSWRAGILDRGAATGEFKLSAPAAKMARLVFGALQGARPVKRKTGDASQLKDVVVVLKSQLSAVRRKAH